MVCLATSTPPGARDKVPGHALPCVKPPALARLLPRAPREGRGGPHLGTEAPRRRSRQGADRHRRHRGAGLGLYGLLIAFSFGGAMSRFDERPDPADSVRLTASGSLDTFGPSA